MRLEKLLEHLREEVRRVLPEGGTHGYGHIERVFKLALHLGRKMDANLDILLPAALLHDIGRWEANHVEAGSRMAREILERLGLKPDGIEAIIDAIKTHSFSEGREPRTLEAKVLSDADKLDAMGAIGIYRAATYSGEHQRSIEGFIRHFYEKLLRLRELLYTEEAKRMAEGRHRFMLRYLEQLKKELNLEA